MHLVAGVRRLFDLDADPDVIDAALARDKSLATARARAPRLAGPGRDRSVRDRGARGPRPADLGRGATRLAGATRRRARPAGAGHRRARPHASASRRPPRSRRPTSDRDAEGAGRGDRRLRRGGRAREGGSRRRRRDLEEIVASLRAIPGIGDWTAQYVAMRGVRRARRVPRVRPRFAPRARRRSSRPGPVLASVAGVRRTCGHDRWTAESSVFAGQARYSSLRSRQESVTIRDRLWPERFQNRPSSPPAVPQLGPSWSGEHPHESRGVAPGCSPCVAVRPIREPRRQPPPNRSARPRTPESAEMPAKHVKARREDRDYEDLVRLYLEDVGRHDLLTKDDEVRLAQAIEAGIEARTQARDRQEAHPHPAPHAPPWRSARARRRTASS